MIRLATDQVEFDDAVDWVRGRVEIDDAYQLLAESDAGENDFSPAPGL